MTDNFSGSDILIVGGAGFVGSNLTQALLVYHPRRIAIVDNLLSSERANIPDHPSVEFVEGSITDERILDGLLDEFDYVFHLATYHGNQSSIHDPIADHDNNLLTTLKLMERVKDFRRIKKFVYAGAGCAVAEKTFDEARATPEDAPISLDMDSPYSISKIVGEFYAVYYRHQHGLPAVRARFQNVFGPGEVLGAGRWRGTPATVWRNVIPTFIYKALKAMPLPVENMGTATRDFIHVADICEGLILCALRGSDGEVYNLASGRETTIMELAVLINQLTGNRAGFEFLPQREWDHSGRRFGSTVKAREEIGFESRCDLETGLRTTVEWTRLNLPLIEACIRKHRQHLSVPGPAVRKAQQIP